MYLLWFALESGWVVAGGGVVSVPFQSLTHSSISLIVDLTQHPPLLVGLIKSL